MYMCREIVQCRPGKVRELVAKFKKLDEALRSRGLPVSRIYTDVSGEHFWTVVVEQDVESLDGYTEMTRNVGNDKELMKLMEGYHDLVIEGRRELYKIE